jgi:hypothetical protein
MVKPDNAQGVAEARRAVVQSIDRGVPVQYGSEEDGVIVGYQKGGAEWICLHPYRDGGKKTFVETKWPWGVAVFTERKDAIPARRDLALEALKQAVEMSKAGESGAYFIGFKAWDVYIERLSALDGADDKARRDSMQGNAWIHECLAQYRDAAARYLRAVASEFGPQAAPHLRKAAECYDKLANHVLRDAQHCVVTVAPYPWTLKQGESWTAETRQGQIQRLKAALPLEREALAEIEKALAATGEGAP